MIQEKTDQRGCAQAGETMRSRPARRGRPAAAGVCRKLPALLLAACLSCAVPAMPAAAAGTGEGFAARAEQEKDYLLQALDRLEEMGLSPIAIWSKITKDDSVPELLETVSQTAAQAAADAAEDLGGALSDAAAETGDTVIGEITEDLGEAAQEQTEAVKQGIIEQIRSWINDFLDGL